MCSSQSPADPRRAPLDAFCAAWNAHDMRAFGRLFTPAADFVNAFGTWWRGREAIEAAHAATHGDVFGTSTLAFEDVELRELAPGLALARAHWHLRGQTRRNGEAATPRSGRLIFVLRETEGAWLIEAAQNTDIAPRPVPD
ncbi:MAG TPA: SgcJ/EcaC family oxidoreductase [Burkholderiaceae bacterium]|jgi:uncharacterized protein (TIGR02246 family)|nr:SgcJ/EcaC family oxidoreductase [Burkholderiaceae bacterium]